MSSSLIDITGPRAVLNYRGFMPDNGRSRVWLWVLIGGGAFFLFVLAVFTLVYVTLHAGGQQAGIHAFGDKIGVVDLEGVIMDPNQTVEQLRKFAEDDSIKAIIIHVNSPGGSRGIRGDLSTGQANPR